MTVNELEKLYFRALGIQQANGIPDLPKSVRDDIAGLAAFVADDRAKPADAEWFAGLAGVRNDHRGLLVRDAGGCVMITCIGGAFCIWSWDWPGGHPTRGQVLDVMAALGGKGGDA